MLVKVYVPFNQNSNLTGYLVFYLSSLFRRHHVSLSNKAFLSWHWKTWFCLGVYFLGGFTSEVNPDWSKWAIVVPFSLRVIGLDVSILDNGIWEQIYWGRDSGKSFFANWKKHKRNWPLSFLWILSCLNMTPGRVAAISRPSQGQIRRQDKANIWKMAEQGIVKNLALSGCHWFTESVPDTWPWNFLLDNKISLSF